jgi:hypothetical protein
MKLITMLRNLNAPGELGEASPSNKKRFYPRIWRQEDRPG